MSECAGLASTEKGGREDEAMMEAAEWVKSQKKGMLRLLEQTDTSMKKYLHSLTLRLACPTLVTTNGDHFTNKPLSHFVTTTKFHLILFG